MRERSYNSASTHSMGGRLLAFLLVFTMLFGVCPAALANSYTLTKAEVSLTGLEQQSDGTYTAPVGGTFGLTVSVATSTYINGTTEPIADNPEVRLYIGNMDNATINQLLSGGKNAAADDENPYNVDGYYYKVEYDSEKNENYILIEPEGGSWGERTYVGTLTGMFDKNTADGSEWNIELVVLDKTTSPVIQKDSTKITAQADVTLSNTKTVNNDSIILGATEGETTLGQDVVYSLSAYTGDAADASTVPDAGEALVRSYTVTDTLTLPEGLYISGSSESDVTNAVTFSGFEDGVYTIKDIVTDGSKITGFSVEYTVTNSSTDQQIPDFVGTVTLKGSAVTVDSSYTKTSADASKITNTVSTAYTTVNSDEPLSVFPVTVDTSVYRPTAASYSSPSKSVYGAADQYGTWDTWDQSAKYVVMGDYVLFKVSFSNSGEAQLEGGTVTDTLPDGLQVIPGLTDDEAQSIASNINIWNCNDGIKAGAWGDSGAEINVSADGKTVSFSNITLASNQTFTGYVLAKVTQDADQILTNTAAFGSGDTAAASVTQKATAPNLEIDKSVWNETFSSSWQYNAGDTVKYTITVSNKGTAEAKGVSIADVFPSALITAGTITVNGAEKSFTPTAAQEEAIKDSTYDFGSFDIAAGESVTITIQGTVNENTADNTIINTASYVYSEETKSDDASLTRVNPASYVLITKTGDHDDSYVQPGDTIIYTITADLNGKEFKESEPLQIKDAIPSGLTYSSAAWEFTTGSGTVSESASGTEYTYSITGTGTVTITITCTVNSDVADGNTFTNTATVVGGSSASSGTVLVGAANAYIVEKTATVTHSGAEEPYQTIAAGEDKAITAGDTITFRIKITNNSGKDLKEFTLNDSITGYYDLVDNSSSDVQVKIVEASDGVTGVDKNVYSWGYTEAEVAVLGFTATGWPQVIGDSTASIKFTTDIYNNDNGKTWSNTDFNIPYEGYIILEYSLTAESSSFTAGSNSAWIGNDAPSTVSYHIGTTEPEDPDSTPAPSNAKLLIDKTVARSYGGDEVKELVYSSENELTDRYNKGVVLYTVNITNDSDYDYVSTNATIYDRLPEQFGLRATSVGNDLWKQDNWRVNVSSYKVAKVAADAEGVEDYKNASWTVVDSDYCSANSSRGVYDANWLAVSLYTESDNKTFKLSAHESFKLCYYLMLTPDIVEELKNEAEKNGSFRFDQQSATNTAYFTADTSFKNVNDSTVSVIADTETVRVRSTTIHPGIKKTAYAYIENASDSIKYSSSGAHGGAHLIWKLRISNDNDTNGTGSAMKKYLLTDTLPAGYKYTRNAADNNKNTYTNTYTNPVSYPSHLSDVNLQSGGFAKYSSDGTLIKVIAADAEGITLTANDDWTVLTWEFDDTNNSDLTLEAGQYLEFTFITETVDSTSKSGVYYNKAVLNVDDMFYEDTVSVGLVENGGVTDGDSFSINTITTTGEILIETAAESAPVSGNGEDRIAEGAKGETVTYTLKVTNSDESGQAIQNLSIINRLPYVGDSGVIVSGNRGSEYGVTFADNMTINIYNEDGTVAKELTTNDYTLTSYSGDISKVFDETSDDWSIYDLEGWSSEFDDGTKLIRIQLGNDDNPIILTKGQYVEVKYNATLPATVSDSDTTAWNSFAYHYDAATVGGASNMASEPSAVGVTLPGEKASVGSIRVRKVFASDKVISQTFYFICEDADGNRYGGVKSATIKSSGKLSAPIYAEVTFTDLPCTAIGKSVNYYIYETDAEGNKLSQKNVPYVMYTGYYRPDLYTYDFANPEAPIVKQGETEIASNITYAENQAYWMKGLSPSVTSNSAIFSNILWAIPTYSILERFYADVPANAAAAESDKLTSTRTNTDGTAAADQESSVRGTGNNTYADDDAGTIYAGAYDGFGGTTHGHTVATGFLASVTSASDSITSITWNITTSATADNPVYVRAPKKLDPNGTFGPIQLDGLKYDDGSEDTGYSIFNVAKGNSYTLKIKDDTIPVISGGGTAYIGLIIDQLYDQNAIAAINFNGEADTTVSADAGDVTAAGTAVKQTQSIRGITSIDYEIKLNNSDYFESADEGAALKASTVEELAKHGITLDAGTRYHDSNHGAYKLQTIDIDAPGAVTITLGDCLYGAVSVQLLDENGNEIDKANLRTGCYHNGAVVELKYTGTAPAKLQVKFSSIAYLPYLKVKSIGTDEPADIYVTESTIYAVGSDTVLTDDGEVYNDDNITVTSVFAGSVDSSKFDNVFAEASDTDYQFTLRINNSSVFDAHISDLTSTGGEIEKYTSSNTVGTALILDVKKSGKLTTYIGATGNGGTRTVQLWDNTADSGQSQSHNIANNTNYVMPSEFDVIAGHQYLLYIKGYTGSFIGFKLEPPTSNE